MINMLYYKFVIYFFRIFNDVLSYDLIVKYDELSYEVSFISFKAMYRVYIDWRCLYLYNN
jgi:hypothetical protein